MGSNSTDALHAFLEEFISRCVVVGDKILTPDQQEKARKEYDPTAGGHRLPEAQVNGRPDLKRGQ